MVTAKSQKVRRLVQLSILLAIEIIIAFVPALGSIPIGPMVATTAHLPVIIAGVTMGVGAGTFMGFSFGLLSFLINSFVYPNITSFVFTPFVAVGTTSGNLWSIVICFLPRILLGLFAGLIFKWLSKYDKKEYMSYVAASLLSSLLHTFLVLGGIFVFFRDTYAAAIGQTADALLGLIGVTILTNGIPEAILAVLVTVAVAKPIRKMLVKAA